MMISDVSAVPVSWSGVIIGALDLRLSGLLDVRSKDSDGGDEQMRTKIFMVNKTTISLEAFSFPHSELVLRTGKAEVLDLDSVAEADLLNPTAATGPAHRIC